jgi:hypothetical protein
MLSILRRNAREGGLANVRAVESRWEDVRLDPASATGVPPADVAVCSFVLPLIAEADAFLAKIAAACRGRAFVTMNATSGDALLDPFWRHATPCGSCPPPRRRRPASAATGARSSRPAAPSGPRPWCGTGTPRAVSWAATRGATTGPR